MTAQNTMAPVAPTTPENQNGNPTQEHPDRATLTATERVKQPSAAAAGKRSSRLADDRRFKIFCGSANRALAEEVCQFLGVPLGQTKLIQFSDGEIHFQLLENVRGAD